MSVLSGTSFRKPFNDVLDLIPKCEKIKQLNAICKICSSSASFTLRTTVDEELNWLEVVTFTCLFVENALTLKQNSKSKRSWERKTQLKWLSSEETTVVKTVYSSLTRLQVGVLQACLKMTRVWAVLRRVEVTIQARFRLTFQWLLIE